MEFHEILWDSGMFFNLPYASITFHRVPSLFLWLWSFTYLILSYFILSHFSNLPLSAGFWWLDIVMICTNIWEVILMCDTGLFNPPKGPKLFSWMINHSVGGEPVTQFSRGSWLGRNWGYGGTRWVVMIMWLTIYGNTKKGNFDGLYKQPQEMVWDRISKKENFDGLYKHFGGAFFFKITKKGNLMDYISRSCDFPKKENW